MPTYRIEISTDKQVCAQCGKKKIGCYRKEGNDYYLCTDCILNNIEKGSEKKKT
jgi:hypothetical protein